MQMYARNARIVSPGSLDRRFPKRFRILWGGGSVDRNFTFGFAAIRSTHRRHVTYLDISSSGSRTGQRLTSTSSPEGGVMSRGRPSAQTDRQTDTDIETDRQTAVLLTRT